MWQDQTDPDLNAKEIAFQKRLVENMQGVCKVFFKGMNTKTMAVNDQTGRWKPTLQTSLDSLERDKVIQTRVRRDTKIKQFHGG